MRPVCLYHAVGGGLGHAVRSLAFARQLRRLVGGRHVVVINTPLSEGIQESGIEIVLLSSFLSAKEVTGELSTLIYNLRPELFVVDTFPRGIGGELEEILHGWSACPRVLLARGLPPLYIEKYRLQNFVQRHYDLVLGVGEPNSLCEGAKGVSLLPFLIRDENELLCSQQAGAVLGSSEPVVLLVGSGKLDECKELAHRARELVACWLDDWPPLRLALPEGYPFADVEHITVRHFPLIECLTRVRLLVCSAGYNSFHEARAMNIPGLFIPRRRLYDDQCARLGNTLCCFNEEIGRMPKTRPLLDAIGRELKRPWPQRQRLSNGARDGAILAAKLLGGC